MTNSPPLWLNSSKLIEYPEALKFMEHHVHSIRMNQTQEIIWCVEHPSVFTAGTSSKAEHLLNSFGFPVYQTGRGGQYTYHGPGQLVVYIMVDLEKRQKDIRLYISTLEKWIIKTLSHFNINAEQRPGRVGLWVKGKNSREEKIAAIGVRVTKWVTWHGLSINVCPNLDHFQGIIPCGLSEYGITSFEELGVKATLSEVQAKLEKNSPF
ncbi:MAG: lipoyl(octanoyl) transferase LipB [Alphaproteobacteria bacterium]|nr:lipoyl(octanoyl) transferase LipB [Alphaproteobacteria bacterium]